MQNIVVHPFIHRRFEDNVFGGRGVFGGERESQVLDKLLQAVMGHIKCVGMEVRIIKWPLVCWWYR